MCCPNFPYDSGDVSGFGEGAVPVDVAGNRLYCVDFAAKPPLPVRRVLNHRKAAKNLIDISVEHNAPRSSHNYSEISE